MLQGGNLRAGYPDSTQADVQAGHDLMDRLLTNRTLLCENQSIGHLAWVPIFFCGIQLSCFENSYVSTVPAAIETRKAPFKLVQNPKPI